MTEAHFNFLSEKRNLSVSLPDELDVDPILSVPIIDGTIFECLFYASTARLALYGLPTDHPVYLEAVVRGTPVTVYDLTNGEDAPNRGRFLIVWSLSNGSAWMTLESGLLADQQIQVALRDIYVYEDDDATARLTLFGNAQYVPPENPLGAEVAAFSGPDQGPVQGVNIYRVASRGGQTRILGSQSQLARIGTRGYGLTVEAVGTSSSGISVADVATAIGGSISEI
ncbi:MAG TPA: hypothetical protein VFM96_13310 [Gaiellaceae bacterium]|nr:hypothetical protein [Gaiellaceae bacterium]